jgi:hypothetical protein
VRYDSGMADQVFVTLERDSNAINAIIAHIGQDLQIGIAGAGDTAAEALRDLATRIDRENWCFPELDAGKPVRVK